MYIFFSLFWGQVITSEKKMKPVSKLTVLCESLKPALLVPIFLPRLRDPRDLFLFTVSSLVCSTLRVRLLMEGHVGRLWISFL